MECLSTALQEVKILVPNVYTDSRGFFLESYHHKKLQDALGLEPIFVQDNHSRSAKYVLRGLHYQVDTPQGKLVKVLRGEVFDVAVDLRKNSSTFGKWTGMYLSDQNHHMAWIPPGFAHGFLALTDVADVFYKVTTFYRPASDRTLLWSDPTLAIQWPLGENESPLLSAKDGAGQLFQNAECYD